MAGAGQKQRGGGSSKNHWPPSAARVLSFFGIGILRSGEDEEDFDDEPHGDDDKVDEDALLSMPRVSLIMIFKMVHYCSCVMH